MFGISVWVNLSLPWHDLSRYIVGFKLWFHIPLDFYFIFCILRYLFILCVCTCVRGCLCVCFPPLSYSMETSFFCRLTHPIRADCMNADIDLAEYSKPCNELIKQTIPTIDLRSYHPCSLIFMFGICPWGSGIETKVWRKMNQSWTQWCNWQNLMMTHFRHILLCR